MPERSMVDRVLRGVAPEDWEVSIWNAGEFGGTSGDLDVADRKRLVGLIVFLHDHALAKDEKERIVAPPPFNPAYDYDLLPIPDPQWSVYNHRWFLPKEWIERLVTKRGFGVD